MTRSLPFRGLLLLLLTLLTAPLRAQTWDWSRAIGASTANGSTSSQRSVTDAAGNSYLTGNFSGTVAFGNSTLTTPDRTNAFFVAKASPSGQWLWAAQASVDSPRDIAVDAAGNVYVTGSFAVPSVTIGSTTLTNVSTASYPLTAYVAKLNSAGQWQWAAQNTGTGYLNAASLDADAAGNVYVTGDFNQGTATFGATTLTATNVNPKPYVAKLSPSGQWLWAVQGSGQGLDRGLALAADPTGGVVVAGSFSSPTLTLGGLTVTTTVPSGSDLFVAKLSANGQWLWANKATGGGNEDTRDITVDTFGVVYLTGSFTGGMVVGNTSLNNSGGSDLFVAKLNSAGQWQWALKVGGASNDEPVGVQADATGAVYVAGSFYSSSLTFGTTGLNASAGSNFVARLSSGGQWLWARNAGNSSTTGLGVDAQANAYVSGAYGFDMPLGNFTLIGNGGSYAAFVAKLDTNGLWQWVLANNNGNTKRTLGTATDAGGNAYVVGTFLGTCAFGSTTLTSGGQFDAYVAKLDAQGNYLWAVRLGGSADEEARSVAVDAAGNVYLTGMFRSTSMFVGTTALSNAGTEDAFVAKLSSTGQWLWATAAGGSAFDSGTAIAVDASGDVRVVGSFSGNNTAFGSFSLNTAGSSDGFVGRLNSNGQWQWVRQIGGPVTEYATSVCLDAAGNTYVGGHFYSPTLTLDAQTLTNSGNQEAFVGKLNANGIWQWARAAGGTGNDRTSALGLDAAGNLFVAGDFNSRSAAFGSFTLASADTSDIYVARLSNAGQWQWATKAGTTGFNILRALTVDASGNAYVTGSYRARSFDFGSQVLGSSGNYYDMYAAKINGAGQWQWATRGGGTGASTGYGIAVDGNGDVYVAGTYSNGPLTLGASTLSGGLGSNDTGFLARLSTIVTASKPAAGRTQLAEAYPNPFGQQLTLRLPRGGATELRVTDALGRLRLQRRLAAGAGQTLALPETAAWPAGVYLLTVRQGAQQQVLKLVRQ